MCGLGLYSPETIQLWKRLGEKDSVGGERGKEIRCGVGRKKASWHAGPQRQWLTGGRRCAVTLAGPVAARWARPRWKAGKRRASMRETGRSGGGRTRARARAGGSAQSSKQREGRQAARGREQPGRGWEKGLGRKLRREIKILFFFLFTYFKPFSNDFESYFEFELNHSIQKFKCNNMSAQTCSYPYNWF
jgi:hypothetical protein